MTHCYPNGCGVYQRANRKTEYNNGVLLKNKQIRKKENKAMSFLSTDPVVQDIQLKVQELCVKLGDACISTSGSTVTVDVQQSIVEVRSAIFVNDSAGTAAPVAAASRSISGTSVTLTLSAALAASDAVIIKYVV